MLTFVNSDLRIPQISGLLWNSGVAIYQIRQRNLIEILKKVRIKDLGESMRLVAQKRDPRAAGKDYANTLSQYKNGKPIGNQFARLLEAGAGMENGWLDVAHSYLSAEGEEAGQIITNMAPEKRAHWMRVLRLEKDRREPGAERRRTTITRGNGAEERRSGTDRRHN